MDGRRLPHDRITEIEVDALASRRMRGPSRQRHDQEPFINVGLGSSLSKGGVRLGKCIVESRRRIEKGGG